MAETKKVIKFEQSGVVLELPESFAEIHGQFDSMFDSCGLTSGNGLAMASLMYFPKTDEEMKEISSMVPQGEEPDEEAMKTAMELLQSGIMLFNVIGYDRKQQSLESVMKIINPDGTKKIEPPVYIGSLEDYEYYLFSANLEKEETQKKLESFPVEMKEECIRILDAICKNPNWFRLQPQKLEGSITLPGTTVSFEVEDLEGNRLTSEKLFEQADITIVDIWRTWCHFCVEEFPDLDEIQKTYKDKGIQVVTVCDDAEDDELKAKAKELSEQYSFLTFVHSDSFNKAFIYDGTPTSYFVDKAGKVLDLPVIGKRPEELKQKLNALLEGTTVMVAEAAQDLKNYTVQVLDQNGAPVSDVTVGFCSDTQCNGVKTDAEGKAVFKGEAFNWHIQVMKLPEGYSDPAEKEVYTDAAEGTVTLTLQKN